MALLQIGCCNAKDTGLDISKLELAVVRTTKGTSCLIIPIFLLLNISCKLTGGLADVWFCTNLVLVGGSAYLVDEDVELVGARAELLGITEVSGKIYPVDEDKVFEEDKCGSYLWTWDCDYSATWETESEPLSFLKLEINARAICKGR